MFSCWTEVKFCDGSSFLSKHVPLSAHGHIRQLNSCGSVGNSEAPELDEKALLKALRNKNQKVTADTGIFPGQHKEN